MSVWTLELSDHMHAENWLFHYSGSIDKFFIWKTNSEELIPQGEADESCMPGVLVTVRTDPDNLDGAMRLHCG